MVNIFKHNIVINLNPLLKLYRLTKFKLNNLTGNKTLLNVDEYDLDFCEEILASLKVDELNLKVQHKNKARCLQLRASMYNMNIDKFVEKKKKEFAKVRRLINSRIKKLKGN